MTEAERQIKTREEEFRGYAKEILDLLPINQGRLLDVGCGVGWVVAEANARGFNGVGIDPKAEYVNSGKKYLHADLRKATLENFKSKGKFDVLVLKHVLEHITEPEKFLEKCKKLLRKDGYIVVACPNIDSLMARIFLDRWYGLQPKEHRNQFTKKSLPKLIKDCGFTIKSVVVTNLGYHVPGWKGIVFTGLMIIADLLDLGDQVIVLAQYD